MIQIFAYPYFDRWVISVSAHTVGPDGKPAWVHLGSTEATAGEIDPDSYADVVALIGETCLDVAYQCS